MTTVTKSDLELAKECIRKITRTANDDDFIKLVAALRVLDGTEIVPDPVDWTDPEAWLEKAEQYEGARYLFPKPESMEEWLAIRGAFERAEMFSDAEKLLAHRFICSAKAFIKEAG